MTHKVHLVDVNAANFDLFPCCGIKNPNHRGRKQKQCWLQANCNFGLRARASLTPDGRQVGYIEYLPGEFAWRGVDAAGYMFVHCVWVHSRQHHGKGMGRAMIEDCIEEARKASMNGVAVMVRDGPWMADRRLFLSNGFELADTAPPDYELLVYKIQRGASNPVFRKSWDQAPYEYRSGLTIVRSSQCPHIDKFATDIEVMAEREFGLRTNMVELQSCLEAQNAPTPYAVFALLYDGRVIADHQISATRFRNIMNKLER